MTLRRLTSSLASANAFRASGAGIATDDAVELRARLEQPQ